MGQGARLLQACELLTWDPRRTFLCPVSQFLAPRSPPRPLQQVWRGTPLPPSPPNTSSGSVEMLGKSKGAVGGGTLGLGRLGHAIGFVALKGKQ